MFILKLIQRSSQSQTLNPNEMANRNATKKPTEIDMPTLDQILMHLDKLRHNTDCLNFILNDAIQQSLQNIYKIACNEDLKRRYADLFTLIDEFEDFKSVQEELAQQKKLSPSAPKAANNNKTPPKRLKLKVKSKKAHKNSSSDSDAPERETDKQPPRKKHKTVMDDTDSS
jgi:hypothetical protein